jgi:hypothetical protein
LRPRLRSQQNHHQQCRQQHSGHTHHPEALRVLQCSPAFAQKVLDKKNAPRETGALAPLFLAKSAQPLRHRRVAWLTAGEPLTVAGPRPIFTAFPAAHACKLKIECMTHAERCQRDRVVDGVDARVSCELFSDFSTAACVFPPAPARLPGNLPGGTVHSEKYSWNVSVRLSATFPCRQEWPAWPSSIPDPSGW